MTFTDLWFRNFRAHKNLHIPLTAGTTGIVGDNGTGKSTVIEGIQFLLTGDLFEGTKEEAINIETASGYIAGAFILNGKKGRIERHLDSSKVVLTYDGEEKKKSSEVLELWDKLLQLNSEVIKKVAIARQGYIPQLFSGDPSVREKVFQKIFLVPPTEKIRSVLWKDYIKQAPPVVPEEDLNMLLATELQIEERIAALEATLKNLKVLDVTAQTALRSRIDHIHKCVDDTSKRQILNDALQQTSGLLQSILTEKDTIDKKLSDVNIDRFQKQQAMLLQQKGIYQQKINLEAQLALLKLPFSEIEYTSLQEQFATLSAEQAALLTSHTEKKFLLSTLKTEIANIEKLEGHAVCPTCKQEIADATSHLRDLNTRFKVVEAEAKLLAQEIALKDATLQKLRNSIESYVKVSATINIKQQQINQFPVVTFDENLLQIINDAIQLHKELKTKQAELEMNKLKTEAKIDGLTKDILNLAVYDGINAQQELEQILQKLTDNVENVRVQQQLTIDLRVAQAELTNIKERITNTKLNHEKNQNRNKYFASLNKVYDILHSSQFPRKLIMSYAEVVTDYLQENLEMFDIPYTARVADNFKIEMLDDHNRVLPSVSGGQEMMVGISLHLALHDLFSQSFPLMIIDEGTTHLDTTNRKAYFDIIKKLKLKSKLKQILIIDHDPQLSEVVDNVIILKK